MRRAPSGAARRSTHEPDQARHHARHERAAGGRARGAGGRPRTPSTSTRPPWAPTARRPRPWTRSRRSPTRSSTTIKSGGHKAALLWAGAGTWYNALTSGAKDAFAELGIEVVAETEADFDPARQATDVETAMALQPDIILTLPVDPVSGAQAFRPAVDAGAKLVFVDNGVDGYAPGHRLRLDRHRRPLRHGQGSGPADVRRHRRLRQDRHHLPRRRVLRHQQPRRVLQGGHRAAATRTSRSWPSRASPRRAGPRRSRPP